MSARVRIAIDVGQATYEVTRSTEWDLSFGRQSDRTAALTMLEAAVAEVKAAIAANQPDTSHWDPT